MSSTNQDSDKKKEVTISTQEIKKPEETTGKHQEPSQNKIHPVNEESNRGSMREDERNSGRKRLSSSGQGGKKKNSNGDNRKSLALMRKLTIDQKKIGDQEVHINVKRDLGLFFNSKIFDKLLIFFVLIYTLIVFLYFALGDFEENDDGSPNEKWTNIIDIIRYIEMGILFLFSLEISLKTYVVGVKKYYSDNWQLFDALVIVLSIILIIMELSFQDDLFDLISSLLRTAFRFLRLFIVYRKVTQVKSTTIDFMNKKNIKSPIEKILEIFTELKENVDDDELVKQLAWSQDKISSNKLYEIELENKDAANWLDTYHKKTNAQKREENKSQQKLTKMPSQQQIKIEYDSVAIPQEYLDHLCLAETDTFDVFKFHEEVANENILSYLMVYLFNRYEVNSALQIDPQKLFNLEQKISAGYHQNPYHNRMHACDVTQTVVFYCEGLKFRENADLQAHELFTLFLGASVHDYDHTGTNNPFLINTNHQLALKYNDKSPLENHHISMTFKLMQESNCNVMENFKTTTWKEVREKLIAMVLCTDMSNHFSDLAKLKGRLSASDFNPKDKDKQQCCEAILHAADMSNPYKPYELSRRWSLKVLDEFWNQGDKERLDGTNISYLCDRYTTNTSKSQIGFIDFVVKPFYVTISQFLTNVDLDSFERNKEEWKKQIDFYEDELEQLANNKQNDIDNEEQQSNK